MEEGILKFIIFKTTIKTSLTMTRLLTIVTLFLLGVFAHAQERFVYEVQFEVAQNASVADAERMFFHFYDGFVKSEACTSVRALQHHTGAGFQYKIMAYSDSWDSLDDMMVQAQTYFASMYPEMMSSPWPMVHTGDAIYAVRTSFEEGYIAQ